LQCEEDGFGLVGRDGSGEERVGHLGDLCGDFGGGDRRRDSEADGVDFVAVLVVGDVERKQESFCQRVGIELAKFEGAGFGCVLGFVIGIRFRGGGWEIG